MKKKSLDDIAQHLLSPDSLATLSLEDAKVVAGYMTVLAIKPGAAIFVAHQSEPPSDYMLLVLSGEVLVEALSSGDSKVIVNILGAGHLIGEMGALDGAPRSASCTAQSEVDVAKLTSKDLERLIQEHPTIAARFLMAIAKRLADRVRLGNHKLLMLNQINEVMQLEMEVKSRKRPHRFTTNAVV